MTAGEVEYVRRFLPRISDNISNKLYKQAVTTSTATVVELFINSGKGINKIHDGIYAGTVPLIEAVRAKNVEVAKFLLDHGCDIYKRAYPKRAALDYAMEIPEIDMSVQMINLLIDHDVDLTKRNISLSQLIPSNREQDSQAIKRLELFKSTSRQGDDFNDVLRYLSEGNCSIDIAEFLLQNGADVNTRGSARHKCRTPLQCAARKTTAQAAQFMKFLLEHGADPFAVYAGHKPGDLVGARNISKWLDMTWDELVESTVAARAVTTKP